MTRRPEYDAKFVVNFYAHFVEGLMKGEQMIIDTMGDRMHTWKMLDIPDNSLDFCLFSFNGLDCNPYEERIKV